MDFSTLQESLMKAKAVMNKTDGIPTGSAQKSSGVSSNLPPVSNNFNTQSINSVVSENKKTVTPSPVTPEGIKNSNLPENIKKLMMEHPIPQVKFGGAIPDSLIEGAAEKMKKMGMPMSSTQSQSSSSVAPPSLESPSLKLPKKQKSSNTKKLSSKNLNTLIKKVVSESLEELIDKKIKKVISESKKTDDTLQVVIGNTILEGKITSTRDLS
jgi:hypothetical protein